MGLGVAELICGIDEVGRGCLAGPLVVVGCVLHAPINGLKDSKKLSAKKREELFKIILENSTCKIVWFSHRKVDELGLSRCLGSAIQKIKEKFSTCRVIMDGNCSFGVSDIQTLVKADDTIKEVSAASIVAKVLRDAHIKKVDKKYPEYGFSSHKGYGSSLHVDMIKKHGASPIQRKSFKIKRLIQPSLF